MMLLDSPSVVLTARKGHATDRFFSKRAARSVPPQRAYSRPVFLQKSSSVRAATEVVLMTVTIQDERGRERRRRH